MLLGKNLIVVVKEATENILSSSTGRETSPSTHKMMDARHTSKTLREKELYRNKIEVGETRAMIAKFFNEVLDVSASN